MSRGWIIAAGIFFAFTCCLGGVITAGVMGPDGIGSEEWKREFGPRDAGEARAPEPVPSGSDAQSPAQP